MKIYLFIDSSVSFSDDYPFAVYRATRAEDVSAAYSNVNQAFGSFCSIVDCFDSPSALHDAFPGACIYWDTPQNSPEAVEDAHDFISACRRASPGRPSGQRKNRIQIRCTDSELADIYDFIRSDDNQYDTITDVLINCVKEQHRISFPPAGVAMFLSISDEERQVLDSALDCFLAGAKEGEDNRAVRIAKKLQANMNFIF